MKRISIVCPKLAVPASADTAGFWPALWLLFALGSTANTIAAAEIVFRCGNSYSQAPCPEGKALDIDDARTGGQRAAAREVATREAMLAAQMTRDRERAEAEQRSEILHLGGKTVRGGARTAPVLPALPHAQSAPRRRAIKPNGNDDDKSFVAFIPRPPKQAAAPPKGH